MNVIVMLAIGAIILVREAIRLAARDGVTKKDASVERLTVLFVAIFSLPAIIPNVWVYLFLALLVVVVFFQRKGPLSSNTWKIREEPLDQAMERMETILEERGEPFERESIRDQKAVRYHLTDHAGFYVDLEPKENWYKKHDTPHMLMRVKSRGWTNVLEEPTEEFLEQCREERRDRTYRGPRMYYAVGALGCVLMAGAWLVVLYDSPYEYPNRTVETEEW
ncbi:hypothetical protein [Alkalicoccus chagannorensis]|uniref:hypothetical protein n=1 Tax=Alkalicoccus chagannorensis TaxID=427072 RepID=UPI000421166A|nr:hypothetical protein [Alkalicoccus chagannorensis]